MIPVRVGFSPTSVITISEPESDAPATIQNAADDMSPGTDEIPAGEPLAARRAPRCRRLALDLHAELGQRALRMVPCGQGFGDRGPSGAWRPASSTALLTWALGTSVWKSSGRQLRGAVDRQRRAAVVRVDARAHALERHDDAPHRAAPAATRRPRGSPQTDAPPGCPPACAWCCRNCRHRAAPRCPQAAETAPVDPQVAAPSASRGNSSIATPSWRRHDSVEAQSPPVE